MTSAGRKLIGAAREARRVARGAQKPASLLVPPDVNVRDIRTRVGLSQESFANRYGFSLNQIRDWEQNRHRPIGALRAYLLVIKQDPEYVARAFQDFTIPQDDEEEVEETLIAL